MTNLLLRLRYLLFRRLAKKHTFTNRRLLYSNDMRSISGFSVKDKEFYNEHPVWFTKDMVEVTGEGISMRCIKDTNTHTSWQGTREANWLAGMIDTRGIFECSMGVWEIEAKICNSWPAIWLLKSDRSEPGFSRKQITPEVDIMEVINNGVEHNLHYGYADDVYVTKHKHQGLNKCDNQWHKFAVECLPNGYRFYVDGILTTEWISRDKEFVTVTPQYLILNNAAGENTKEDTDFIIKSIKVYK